MKKIVLFVGKYKMQLAILFVIIALVDTFMFEFINDLVVLFLLSFWIFIVWLYRWQSRVLVLLGFILLPPATLFLIFKVPSIAEKFALWTYIFFTTAVAKEVLSKLEEKWFKKE